MTRPMRALLPAVAVPLLLSGCGLFDTVKDTVQGAVDPMVAVGLVDLVAPGTDLPDDVEVPERFQSGTGATIFLADARSVDDLANAPVEGADLVLEGCATEVAMTDQGSGAYTHVQDGDAACTSASWTVRRTDSPVASLPVTIPEAVDLDLPVTWTAGDDLALDLADADWGGAIVVVLDAQTGDVTYSSEPEGIVAWYQLLTSNQDLSDVVIPGSAFRDDTVHVVAVTGLVVTRRAELDGVNTLLSTVAGGRTLLGVVSTVDLDTDTL